MALKIKTAPAAEPFEVAELKNHLRIAHDTSEDETLELYIIAARDFFEKATNRALVTQTWELYRRSFAPCIEIPLPPLRQVNSVKYIDVNGDTQTVATSVYQVDNVSQPGRLLLRAGQSWPTPKTQENAVIIEFEAGFGGAAEVPEMLKHGMKILCGHWYENRSAVAIGNIVNDLPLSVQSIIAMHKNYRFG